MRLIDADAFLERNKEFADRDFNHPKYEDTLRELVDEEPTVDAVEVVRCKDCIHQQKVFHEDKRIKEGGYYICGCELADGYSVVCLDADFCSRGKRRSDG